MKVREVEAGYGFTINLGNYSSGRIEGKVRADVEPGETVEEAFEKAFKVVLTETLRHMDKLDRIKT